MSEHSEQVALFEWAAWVEPKLPALRLMFAIPNGGKRDPRTGAMLKAEGVRAGVPDILLAYPIGAYAGCFVELKVGKNTISDSQEQWIDRLRAAGYFVDIAWGWQSAARVIADYLGVAPESVGL